jgi:hypothetical protein
MTVPVLSDVGLRSVELQDADRTFTTTPVQFMPVDNTYTLNNSNIAFRVLDFSGTVLNNDDTGISNVQVFRNTVTLKNVPGSYIGLTYTSFNALPTITEDTDTSTTNTLGTVHGFQSLPTFSRVNSGTLNVTTVNGFNAAAPAVGAGCTVTTVRGLNIADPTGSGTVTNNIGVDIAALTKGATINAGIRNAAPYIATPSSAQNITAVSATISANAQVVQLTANGSYTLTSAPTIANGQDGQIVTIINVDSGSDVITIQDQGTLASSNLRLVGTSCALGPRDSIMLMYSSTVGDWVEIARSNVT